MSPRRQRPFAERFWQKVDIREWEPGDCWEWTASTNGVGYGKISSGGDRGRLLSAHRVAYEMFHGTIPGGPSGGGRVVIRHRCDNRLCVNPAHLEVGTQVDNVLDMVERGRSSAGSRHGNSRLTENDVREIRKSSESGTALAARFRVQRNYIYAIRSGRVWKHVS